MRIRKGFLLSSSSSSYMQSVSHTASDPQLNQPTTWHELHPVETHLHPQPSDPSNRPPLPHPPHIVACKLTNTRHKFQIKHKVGEQVKLEEASRKEEEEEDGVGTRKQNIILAAAPVTETVVLAPLSSRQVDERWFDVDKKIPLKKRKGLAVEKTRQETPILEEAKKMKSKTNKKCSTTNVQQYDGKQDKAGNVDCNATNHNMNIVKKINKRGGAIMEGSRCSRVNGRGWRCRQQTLVGYSLCEHHLGKGRLRSITNVKGRAKMPTAAPHNDITHDTTNDDQPAEKVRASWSVVQPEPALDYKKERILLDGSCYDDDKEEDEDGDGDDDDDYNDDEMKKPQLVKKKRMKLGMVKARSLSSLLNQTNNAVAVAADDI